MQVTTTAVLLCLTVVPASGLADEADVSERPLLPRVVVIGRETQAIVDGLRGSGRVELIESPTVSEEMKQRIPRWALLARTLDLDWIIRIRTRKPKRRVQRRVVIRDRSGRTLFARHFRGTTNRLLTGWLLERITLVRPESRPPPAVAETRADPPAEVEASEDPEAFESPFDEDPSTGEVLKVAPVIDPGRPAGQRDLPVQLSGDIQAGHMSYLLDRQARTVNTRNEASLHLIVGGRTGSVSKYVRAEADGLLRIDESDPDRTEAFFSEAYVEAGLGPAILTIGKRLLGWGAADAFNPVDVIKQVDYRDLLQVDDRGLFLLRAQLLLGANLSLEGVWVPSFSQAMQPGPTGMDENGRFTSTNRWYAPPPMALEVLPAVEPGDNSDAFQYATRLGMSSDWLDVYLTWVYGYLPIPYYTMTPPNRLQGDFYRRHLVGLDMQTTIGRLLVKAEGAASFTDDIQGDDDQVPDSFVTYVLQMEYKFAMLAGSENSIRVIALFLGDHNLKGEDLDIDVLHPFRFQTALRISWEYRDHTGMDSTWMYDFRGASLIRLDLWHEPVDGLRMELAGEYLTGEEGTFFGTFARNHRVQARLKYSF